jgi:hypothetical protein
MCICVCVNDLVLCCVMLCCVVLCSAVLYYCIVLLCCVATSLTYIYIYISSKSERVVKPLIERLLLEVQS